MAAAAGALAWAAECDWRLGLFFLEHLECGHQPHAQDRGAEKRTQLTDAFSFFSTKVGGSHLRAWCF